ncbi:MAG TPA: PQQ-dependent sugar dehydrogenase [Bacteroidia bacterium]|nr:PQQ-dependent sugar dehydrogenase [Bacteroidia bacterium]
MRRFIQLLLVCCCQFAYAQPAVKLIKIASGFTSPLAMAEPHDGTHRLFVAEQRGKIFIISKNEVLKEPFLDISGKIDGLNLAYSEKGLLGFAFHPDYSKNGRFFVYYSAPLKKEGIDHKGIVAEFHVNPANPNQALAVEQRILEVDEPEGNHNGGNLVFGPDGYLYIGLGDGGGANDEHGRSGNGQNTTTLLGKILRIDVDGKKPYAIPPDNPFAENPSFKPEIWAYGLRNPWRFSFDKTTGRLFCGDVGQNKFEEIDLITKGGNYGWRVMEGLHCFNPPEQCVQTGLTLPIYEYNHETGISVCGGYVYRGKKYPALTGYYFFGDWSGKLFCLKETAEHKWELKLPAVDGGKTNEVPIRIHSFAEDANGEIYIIGQHSMGPKNPTGTIYRIAN